MIDLDKMEASVNQLMGLYPKDTRATQTIGDVHGLITRLRQAEKDAARYRWLIKNCGEILEPARNRTHLYIPNYCPPSIDYVDVSGYIDKAMQCK